MQEIRFPTHDVTFPAICSCCGKPATHTLKQTREDLGRLALAATVAATRAASGTGAGFASTLRRSVEVAVPVCLACKRHTDWDKGGGYFGLVLAGALGLGAFGLAAAGIWAAGKELFAFDSFLHYPRATFIGLEALALAIAAIPIWRRQRNNVGGGPQHLSGDDPVEILRFDAESLTLRVRRGDLMAKLLEANPGAAATPPRAARVAATR
jgi:hypothetical protein